MPTNISYDELIAQISALQKQVKYISDTTDKTIAKQAAEIKELKEQNEWFRQQLKLSKKKVFGPSSEAVAEGYGEQLSMFNEAEAEREVLQPEPEIEEVVVEKHTRKKKRSIDEKYGNLPVEEIIYEPDEKTCDKCGNDMTFLKYESRKEIKIVPAQISVVEHKKAVYVCKECDKNGTESNFVSGTAVAPLVEKSLVSPSMMAHIMNQKFCNAMPLYRQEQELKRMGVKLSRQTMANWMIAGAGLLKPIYEEMHKILVSEKILHADETPLEVLCEPDRPAQTKSYMWLYRTGRFAECNIVLYDYHEGRSGDFSKEFLNGFAGYLHCDGWHGYDKVENIRRVGCWAHVRRYFKNALDVQTDKTDYSTIAGQGFLRIERLFAADEKRTEQREFVDEFFKWCIESESTSLPKSLTGKAISYAIKQENTLRTFLEDAQLEMTNNRAERAIKPFVIGRKNWLFCNTPGGAKSSACIYSVVETVKENGLKPYEYLNWLFEHIRLKDYNRIEELLPWSKIIPDNIRTA